METKSLKEYLKKSHDLLNSFVLVLPLLIFYQIGILYISNRGINGVDFLTIITWKLAGVKGLFIVNFVLNLMFLTGVIYLRNKQRFQTDYILPIIIESMVYALTMGILIIFVLRHTLPMSSSTTIHIREPIVKILICIGAGVHEELVFRLILMSLIIWICVKPLQLSRAASIIIGILVSSAVFSLAHYYLGGEKYYTDGEWMRQYRLIYRFLAGIIFAVIFKFRSFAVAVYTHTLYNFFVLFRTS
ncbi:MAG: CPBP family intramembrane glutamic endopeptidase [Planctomycetota bacterium]